ncbi:hypothetical protein ACFQJ7_10510 [Halovenus rubra]|uniref:Uncharacterized protein n=2 Tax=Halovenus rubra TaxID=869890 RepID=A0ACC7DXS7_9EURY|nr:hypothetical protein [Halovenus rubra]
MICRVGDVVRCGEVVSIEPEVTATTVADAVRTESTDADDRIEVSCPTPSLLHEAVGCLYPGMGVQTKTALARAARTRGMTTPYDEDLEAARAKLTDVCVESISLRQHREVMAGTEETVEQARVRAAEARGRVRECEENGLATDEANSRLAAALQYLSEAETAAIAAEQAYTSAREQRRAQLDNREQRFRLQDRVANYEREAHAYLVDQLRDEFSETLTTLSEMMADQLSDALSTPIRSPFDVEPVPAALAVGHLGNLSAPVVLAIDWFESPSKASEWLDTSVIHI